MDGIHPVAIRIDFDGYGWMYIDDGAGSSWQTLHPDAEPLYTAEALTLAEQRGRAAGRAEERADIVAWLRERAGKANEQAESALAAGKRRDWVELLIHSQECFETAALGIETGAHAKAPAERQDGGERA